MHTFSAEYTKGALLLWEPLTIDYTLGRFSLNMHMDQRKRACLEVEKDGTQRRKSSSQQQKTRFRVVFPEDESAAYSVYLL